MTQRSVSIRLGTTGKADVTRALDDIATSGDASARRLARSYQRAGEDMEAAMRRQQATAAKLAVLAPGLNGSKLDRFAGVNDNVGKSAQSSAAVFESAYAGMEARAHALRAAIDPVYAAQARFDNEMREAKLLLDQGAISSELYARAQARSSAALNSVVVAQTRAGGASNAHRMAMQGLSYQAQDTFTQLSMGAQPLQVIAIQGAQAAGQMAGLEGRLGSIARFLTGPWGLAITGGLLVLGMMASRSDDAAEASGKQEKAAQTLREQIDELNEALGRQVQTADQAAAAALRNAAALRRLALDARAATVEALRNARAKLAAAIGDSATPDPNRGQDGGIDFASVRAGQLESKLRLLDKKLADQQRDVANSEVAFRTAQLPIMQARVAAATDGATAATKRYDKALADLNDRFRAGRLSQADYERQLGAAAKARDSEVERTRKTDRKGRGGSEAEREAKERARDTERLASKLSALQGKFDPLATAAREYATALSDIAEQRLDPSKAAEYADAAKAAFVKARAAAFDLPAVDSMRPELEASDRADNERRELAERRAEWMKETLADQSEALELARAELGLAAANDNVRDATMSKLRVILDLKRRGVDAEDEQGQKILANAEYLDQLKRKAREAERGWADLRDVGETALNTLFDPRSADSWGDRIKAVLGDLKAELIRLALLNPLKNMLLDKGLPTLGSLVGRKGGVDSFGNFLKSAPVVVPKNAAGTEWFSGGATWLAENGPELVTLPRGSKVYPAAETRRMFGGAASPQFHFDLRGAVMTEDLLRQMRDIGRRAADDGAIRGAHGGAQLAMERSAEQARRGGRPW